MIVASIVTARAFMILENAISQDRAGVGIHAAGLDAEHAERHDSGRAGRLACADSASSPGTAWRVQGSSCSLDGAR